MRKRSGYGANLKSSIFFQNKKYFVDPISRNFNKTTKVLSLYGVSLTLLGYTLKGQKNSVHPDEKYFFRLLAQKIEVSFFGLVKRNLCWCLVVCILLGNWLQGSGWTTAIIQTLQPSKFAWAHNICCCFCQGKSVLSLLYISKLLPRHTVLKTIMLIFG